MKSSARNFLSQWLCACAALAFPLTGAAQAPPASNDNPLLTESSLPYQFPPFDRIKNEHYQPAIERGMREELTEVEAIAGNPEHPTFDNTIVAMERTGRLLDRAARVFFNLSGTNTNPAMQNIQKNLAPVMAAHADSIALNGKLFARIQTLYNEREKLKLDRESKYLLELYYDDFLRRGAKLSDPEKQKLRALNEELATLQTAFTQNVLKERNASSIIVDSRADLDGTPESEIAAAASAARQEGKEGKFVIRLDNTSGQPPLAFLKNRALRRRILEASLSRNSRAGEFDNRNIVSRIARLRADRAKMLGFESHAAYQLKRQMAGSVDTVNKLLSDIAPKAVENALREVKDMQAVIDREGGGFKLESWDWDFYAEKVRKARFAFDGSQLRPYFEMNRVLQDGVFFAATKLYGLTFKERRDLPMYHPDLRVFEVFDSGGKPLALFIADYYARPSKRGGAWANSYVDGSGLLGGKVVTANHLNVPKPSAGEPTLLTWEEVTTAFHEFGHALHRIVSDVRYPRLGTSGVPRDFVEFPSQVNEMWATWPDVLRNYAKHHQTGEPMPAELLGKFRASENFNQGFRTTEYLAASLLDQAWHQVKPEQAPADPLAFEAGALKKAGVDLSVVPPRYRSTYFSHIFAGGYAAGYYSYIWSEVLDADTVEWFRENGGLKRENGDRFRKLLLSRGAADDAMNLFRDFRGRDPKIEPLLKRRGLDRSVAAK